MTGNLRRIFRGTQGSQIAEAALIFPVMFALFIAIFWFGRAFNIYATINQAAREGARAATSQTCATCGAGPNSPLSVDQVADVVRQSLIASKISTANPPISSSSPAFPSCGGGAATCQKSLIAGEPQICVYYNVRLDLPTSPGPAPSCGVVVNFQYGYSFSLPFTSLNNQTIQIPASVQMTGEY